MVKFSFTINDMDDSGDFDFSQGDMIVKSTDAVVGTNGSTMMMLISIAMLLDGFRQFIRTKASMFEFMGVDSTFKLRFVKSRDQSISIQSDGRLVATENIILLSKSLYLDVLEFIQNNKKLHQYIQIESTSAVLDIKDSLRDFKNYLESMGQTIH